MRKRQWLAAMATMFVAGCAAGADDSGGGGNGQGGIAWTSSSSGGGAQGGNGVGGNASQGGNGQGGEAAAGGGTAGQGGGGNGQGGLGVAGMGAGGMGAGGMGAGGSPPVDELLFFAAGSSGSLTGRYSSATNWQTTALAGGTGLAAISGGALDSVAITQQTSDAALHFSVWGGANWTALSGIAAGVTGQGIAATYQPATANHLLVFQGTNYLHYFAMFAAGSWNPSAEPVTPNGGSQSFGPSPAAIAPMGNNVMLAFAGNDTLLYMQPRNNGSWIGAKAVPNAQTQLTPALVVPAVGPELFAVWVNHDPAQFDDKKLFWAARTNGQWSTVAKISDNAFTDDPVSAAALANGDVVVAFRGTDSKPYTVRYSMLANPPWSAPAAIATTNPTITGLPAVAAGATGADAELLYIDAAAGDVRHTRLVANSWSAAATVGGSGLTAVAVTRRP